MIVVTGGAGKAGRAVVRELLEAGEEVLSVDLVRSPELDCEQLVGDLVDYGVTEVYPDVPIRGDVGEHETLLSIAKARRLLGYEPRHSWRNSVLR